jgi:hypothetical protein
MGVEICVELKSIYHDRSENYSRHVISIHFTCIKLLYENGITPTYAMRALPIIMKETTVHSLP